MRYTTSLLAVVMAVAQCGRIPLHRNEKKQLTTQIEHITTSFLSGEHIETNNYEDWSYFVEVDIGTPPQSFMMGLSTFTSDSWVFSKQCWSLPCFWMPLYDSSKSSTYVKDDRPWQMMTPEVKSGGVQGNLSTDTFRLGDIVANNYTFAEVKKIGGNDWVFKKQNGVIGLAYNTKNVSITGNEPFLHQANPGNKSFSLYFQKAPKESYMWLPGMDTDNFEIIKTHKVINKMSFLLNLDSLKYGDKVLKPEYGLKLSIINAYDQILGFNKIMDPILDNVVVYKDCSNIDQLPDFTLTLDGVDYTLTGHDYVIKHLGNCVNGITTYDRPSPGFENAIVVGNIFLQKFFPMFDMDNDTVTFQAPKATTITENINEVEL